MTVQTRIEPTDNTDMDLEQGMIEQDPGSGTDEYEDDRRLANGRFPPGRSGNRRGRPKKTKRKEAEPHQAQGLMEAVTYGLAEVRSLVLNGVQTKMPTHAIIARKMIDDMLTGSPEVRIRMIRQLKSLGFLDALQALQERWAEEERDKPPPWTDEMEEQFLRIEAEYGAIEPLKCPNCGTCFSSEANPAVEEDQFPDETS